MTLETTALPVEVGQQPVQRLPVALIQDRIGRLNAVRWQVGRDEGSPMNAQDGLDEFRRNGFFDAETELGTLCPLVDARSDVDGGSP